MIWLILLFFVVIVVEQRKERIVKFRVSDKEYELIKQRAALSGVANLSVYLRRMAMEGYILNLEIPEMREVLRLTNRISGNINQIAKHVHSTGRLYKDDLEDICKQQDRIWEVIRNILLKLEAV